MQIGPHNYNINEECYVAGDIGANPMCYPRLSSFNNAYINCKNGMSLKYPEYHFNFKQVQYNKYDSGLASIYKLIITKNI
jgi:hypothetical protein